MDTLLGMVSTRWERAIAGAMEPAASVESAINGMRRFKYVNPRASMLPYLVWEYGLGELTPYVPNLYNLIDQGVRWQRLRGTVSAVAVGLAWIGYSATLEEEWTGRRFWNSFQLRFPSLPLQDDPDLARIEGITGLSVPLRSRLRRGVHRYDVPALEAEDGRLDESMLDFESGIAVTDAGTLWSFGRVSEFEHLLTKAEGVAIGNWLDPVDETVLTWPSVQTPWVDANFLWADSPDVQRRAILAGWFRNQVIYLRLEDAAGDILGFRHCRAVRPVSGAADGPYRVGGLTYGPSTSGSSVYVEAMTQFGDFHGQICSHVSLIVGAQLAAGIPLGRQRLAPAELIGGHEIARQAVTIPLRTTVRDQFKFRLRF